MNFVRDIEPFDKDKVLVVIETPGGSRNKFAFDEELCAFKLKKILPSGMIFPYAFGFVPRTLEEDGDPSDVLVLMEEPAFPGCVVECRIIGVIDAEQRNNDRKDFRRNPRYLGVSTESTKYRALDTLNDLDPALIKEIEDFFHNYLRAEGKEIKVKGRFNSAKALKQLLSANAFYKKEKL